MGVPPSGRSSLTLAPSGGVPQAPAADASIPDSPAAIEEPTASNPDAPPASAPADDQEENIYEVMKQHMARKKEEIDAQNAAWKQGAGAAGGRPGPRLGPGTTVPQPPPGPKPIPKVSNLSDLPAVWEAARQYLAANARTLESVLGSRTQVGTLNPQSGEITLLIPEHFKGYANERARPRLEEALKAVTGLPVKLDVQFTQQAVAAPQGGDPTANMGVAQRIPPELMEAVKKQPVIRELMKRLEASVTQVEVLEEGRNEE